MMWFKKEHVEIDPVYVGGPLTCEEVLWLASNRSSVLMRGKPKSASFVASMQMMQVVNWIACGRITRNPKAPVMPRID